MRLVWSTYAAGVAALAALGFLSPFWPLGFLPIGAGLIWAAYDLVEVATDDDASPPPL